MLRVGLTGGIACGKSRVLARLARRGFAALDLDAVAHQILAPGGAAHGEVVAAFGTGIVAADGTIDRRALSALVFADEGARLRLNAIVHPRIRLEEARLAADEERRGAAVLITDAALLIESGLHLRFDRIVVVHCRPEQQLERLILRDGLDPASARARIEAQMPVEEKRLYGHMEIDASGTVGETDAATDALAPGLAAVALGARASEPAVPIRSRALAAFAHWPRRGPRGLTPVDVADSIVEAGGLDLAAISRRLVPPALGPWYRAARPGETVAAWTLAVPLVLWAARRRYCDPEYVAGAAASLAAVTHERGPSISDAALVAVALWRSLVGKAGAAEEDGRLAARWGGGPTSVGVQLGVGSAGSPRTPAGGDRELAECLGAAAGGALDGDAPVAVRRAIDRILA